MQKQNVFFAKIDAESMKDGVSASFFEIAKSTLTLFSSTCAANSDSHAFVMADSEDVQTFMKDLFLT